MLTRPVLVAVGDVGSVAANVFQTILWVEETVRPRDCTGEMAHQDRQACRANADGDPVPPSQTGIA